MTRAEKHRQQSQALRRKMMRAMGGDNHRQGMMGTGMGGDMNRQGGQGDHNNSHNSLFSTVVPPLPTVASSLTIATMGSPFFTSNMPPPPPPLPQTMQESLSLPLPSPPPPPLPLPLPSPSSLPLPSPLPLPQNQSHPAFDEEVERSSRLVNSHINEMLGKLEQEQTRTNRPLI